MKKILCVLLSMMLFSAPTLAFTKNDFNINSVQVPLSSQLKLTVQDEKTKQLYALSY